MVLLPDAVKMKFIILIIFLFLLNFAYADTTFYENPNEALILGTYTAEAITSNELTGRATGTTSCVYMWNCTNWSRCLLSGKQTRICNNIGTCSNTYLIPETEQNCTYHFFEIKGKFILEEDSKTNKLIIYSAAALIILFAIFYLEKDKIKRAIKRQKRKFISSKT
jgi:hypothetical protein